MLSLAIVDVEHSEPGTEVTLVWGEERRRIDEADRRAARADGDSRHRAAGADLGSRARRPIVPKRWRNKRSSE